MSELGTINTTEPPLHRHWLVFHRHPDWHGHCYTVDPYMDLRDHRCRRWHFHLPFKHRHTPSGR